MRQPFLLRVRSGTPASQGVEPGRPKATAVLAQPWNGLKQGKLAHGPTETSHGNGIDAQPRAATVSPSPHCGAWLGGSRAAMRDFAKSDTQPTLAKATWAPATATRRGTRNDPAAYVRPKHTEQRGESKQPGVYKMYDDPSALPQASRSSEAELRT